MTQENAIEKFKPLVPEGYDVRDYLGLVRNQLMGVDKAGNARSGMDLMFFLSVAKKVRLDPLARQIFPVFRWDGRQGKEVMAIQTSIDGFRLIAQRSGDYAGQDDAVIEEENGKPIKASVTVYKMVKGVRCPVTASARFAEYVQRDRDGNPMGLWTKMPYAMLSKCAESLALRKAFPAELSGLYTSEEMSQSHDVDDVETLNNEQLDKMKYDYKGGYPTNLHIEDTKEEVKKMEEEPAQPEPASPGQVKMIYAVAKTKGISAQDIKDSVKEKYGLESFTKLTKKQASEVLEELLKMKTPEQEEDEGFENPEEVDDATTFDKEKK